MKSDEKFFTDDRWYNATQAVAILKDSGSPMSRTTFWRRVCEGSIKWRLRRNFRGKWYKGRDLNQFFNAVY